MKIKVAKYIPYVRLTLEAEAQIKAMQSRVRSIKRDIVCNTGGVGNSHLWHLFNTTRQRSHPKDILSVDRYIHVIKELHEQTLQLHVELSHFFPNLPANMLPLPLTDGINLLLREIAKEKKIKEKGEKIIPAVSKVKKG